MNSPTEPDDAQERRAAEPIVCYRVENLPAFESEIYKRARLEMSKIGEVVVPPRDGRAFRIPAGHFFRITSVDGPQVGDLNLWNPDDLSEQFFSGKTRQLQASHLTTGDRLWSTLPALRPMATITHDTLGWYGWDDDGAGIHDVMNVFLCTGFSADTHQYFMKASPVRPGDYLEFFAEMNLLGALSACPGGDCASSHSDDSTPCYPLLVEIFEPSSGSLDGWQPTECSAYNRTHGL